MTLSLVIGLVSTLALPSLTHAQEGAPVAEEAAPVAEEVAPVSFTAETGVYSTNVVHGVRQFQDPLDPVSRTSASVAFNEIGPGAIEVAAYNAVALAHYDEQGPAALEFDLYAGYKIAFEDIATVSLGYQAYLFPHAETVDGAHEIILSGAFKTIFEPSLTIAAEFIRVGAVYIEAGIGHTINVVEDVLSFSARLTFATAAADGAPFHVHNTQLTVGGRWSFVEHFFMTSSVAGAYDARPSDLQARPDMTVSKRFTVFAGFGLGVEI